MNTPTKQLLEKKVKLVKVVNRLLISFLVFFSMQISVHAATYYSIATGNWNSNSTWSTSSGGNLSVSYPQAGDNVVIEGGYTVSVNTISACATVIIGYASTGSLSFNASQSLTVSDSVKVVAINGILDMSSGGTLNIGGNFTNAGTFNSGSGTLVMNGSSQQTIQSSTANNLTLNNSAGIILSSSTSTLTVNGTLTLTNGEFNIGLKELVFANSSIPIARTNGTIDASSGTLTFSAAADYSIVSDFTTKNIKTLFMNTSNSYPKFLSDTIKVTKFSHLGTVTFKCLWFTDTFSYSRINNVVNWSGSNPTLILGDGTTHTANISAPFIGDVAYLIVDCGSGTVDFQRAGVYQGTKTVTKGLVLKSGTLSTTMWLQNFIISNNATITRINGSLSIQDNSRYSYGTGISVNYTGSNNLTIGDEIKTGSSAGSVNINLSDNTKTIAGKSSSSLGITNDLTISSGTLALGNSLNLGGNLTIAASGATFTPGSNQVTFNGSSTQTLTKTGGGTITVTNFTVNNSSGGVSLAGGSNASNLSIGSNGSLTLSNGLFSIGSNTFTFGGSSIIRTSGSIDASSGTMALTNTSSLSLPVSVFNTNTLNNLTLNGSGGISLGGNLTIGRTLALTKGTLTTGTNMLTYSGSSITRGTGNINANSGTMAFSINGNNSLNLPGGVFSGDSLNNLTLNGSAGISLGGNLTIGGTLALTNGTLSIGANTLTNSGNNITRSLGNIDASAGTMAFTNSLSFSLPSTLFLGNSFNNLTLNGSGGISLGSDLIVTGVLALTAGALTTGTNTLTYSGSSISRTSGNINASSGTIIFTNANALSLPSNIFYNDTLNNLTLNGSGGISLGDDLTVGGTLVLSKGTLTTGTKILTYSGSSITRSTGKINSIGGTLSFTNSSALTVPASVFVGDSISNLQVSGSGALTLGGTCRIATSKSVTVTSPGVLNTGGNLILTGNTSSPAYIANSSGTINGNVTVEVAMPSGRRAFRLLSHPFSSSIALSSLQDNIHITGAGGASNGFDATLTNNPSAYNFAESGYTGTTNTGWTAFTNTSNTIATNTALRILYRGPRSQSNLLDGSTPTPNACTIDWSGPVNQGSINVAMTYTSANGSNAGWNLIPNPYPSNVDIGNIASGNRNGIGTFSVWVPTNGTKGAYVSHSFGSSYILASGSAFFVQTASAANFTFTESTKTGSSATENLLKTAAHESHALELSLLSNDSIYWDKLVLKQQEGSIASQDVYDGPKLSNPDVNFYSLGASNEKLAIDSRNSFTSTDVVKLGMQTSSSYHFTLRTDYMEIPNTEAYLIDSYLNTRNKLVPGFTYDFTTTNEPTTVGENRFRIEFNTLAIGLENIDKKDLLTLYPNPCKELLFIANLKPSKAEPSYKILDLQGKEVASGTVLKTSSSNAQIMLNQLVPGVYFIQVNQEDDIKLYKIAVN
ncbi:MAG: hypothetical protein CFE21_02605 [Bacteroidetes bacterium B1(2017)]|nr:MAG: hypothetical protein CFE21_02605 [Bacteroidetes bacterium B1(2017)]